MLLQPHTVAFPAFNYGGAGPTSLDFAYKEGYDNYYPLSCNSPKPPPSPVYIAWQGASPAKEEERPKLSTLIPEPVKDIEEAEDSSLQDLEAAEEAVELAFKVSRSIVRLAIEAKQWKVGPWFSNIEELSNVSVHLVKNPHLQAELCKKIHQAKVKAQAEGDARKEIEAARVLKVKEKEETTYPANLKDSAEDTTQGRPEPAAQSTDVEEKVNSGEREGSPSDGEGSGDGDGDRVDDRYEKPLAGMSGDWQSTSDQHNQTGANVPTLEENTKPVTEAESDAAATPRATLKKRIKKLNNTNRKLKAQKVCRGCRKVELSESGVTFLPCGHFITCERCSEEYDKCLACGSKILATVKTFLS